MVCFKHDYLDNFWLIIKIILVDYRDNLADYIDDLG